MGRLVGEALGMGGGGPSAGEVGAPWAVGVGVAYLEQAGTRDELSCWRATSGSCTARPLACRLPWGF